MYSAPPKFLFACSFGYFVRLPLHGLHSSRGLALLAQVVVGFRPPTSCSPLVSYHQAKIRGERQGITEAIGTMKHGRQNAVAQQHPKDTYTPLIYAHMYPAWPRQQHQPQSPGGMPSWLVGPPLPPGPRPAATRPSQQPQVNNNYHKARAACPQGGSARRSHRGHDPQRPRPSQQPQVSTTRTIVRAACPQGGPARRSHLGPDPQRPHTPQPPQVTTRRYPNPTHMCTVTQVIMSPH